MKESNSSLIGQQQLSQLLESHRFEHYGFVQIAKPVTFDFYKSWLSEGLHGSMSYLERHAPIKESPEMLLQSVQTAIVVGCNYIPHPMPLKSDKSSALRIATYARGEDYHDWLKARLEGVVAELKTLAPHHEFLAVTDSGPVLERDLAYQAGLGWFGKNTCLIDQKRGSFFLIGEILTTLPLSVAKSIHPDRCGTCTRCIDACPTQALTESRKLDARRCISYLTIESKELPPEELREGMGDNFFGCDICQAVCPWNEKIFGEVARKEQPVLKAASRQLEDELRFILTQSHRELERHFAGTPLSRAKGFGLKRNALIVATNHKLVSLSNEIAALATDSRLGELAKWALARLQIEI